ncbi:hypothetical protein, partial [Microcoleus sp. herbarium5]|uniref:hypothetical protein n=1 Tax=Microcoleus sp. herbarium5 TaxID=3055434 RepID=UPI002FD4043D
TAVTCSFTYQLPAKNLRSHNLNSPAAFDPWTKVERVVRLVFEDFSLFWLVIRRLQSRSQKAFCVIQSQLIAHTIKNRIKGVFSPRNFDHYRTVSSGL